jgi:hypothetical protein
MQHDRISKRAFWNATACSSVNKTKPAVLEFLRDALRHSKKKLNQQRMEMKLHIFFFLSAYLYLKKMNLAFSKSDHQSKHICRYLGCVSDSVSEEMVLQVILEMT